MIGQLPRLFTYSPSLQAQTLNMQQQASGMSSGTPDIIIGVISIALAFLGVTIAYLQWKEGACRRRLSSDDAVELGHRSSSLAVPSRASSADGKTSLANTKLVHWADYL
jgi:hypothetical protein